MIIVDFINYIKLRRTMQDNVKKMLIILPIMAIIVATLTAIMTWVNLTPTQHFSAAWLNAFTFAFLVMLPLGAVLFSLLNKLVERVFTTWSSLQKNLVHGVLMALIMESVMAIVTTITTYGHQLNHEFFSLFLNSLMYALPVGLTITSFMSLVIKPKLEQHLTQVAA